MQLRIAAYAAVLALCAPAASRANSDIDRPPNCASASLFMLSQLLGISTPLDTLVQELYFEDTHDRASIDDLVLAAKRNGIYLQSRVVRVPEAFDRPVIAYMKLPDEGHFIVLNPVGGRRTMVQLLDSSRLPTIIDYSDLFADPTWSGIVLAPSTRWERWRPLVLSITGAAATLALVRFGFARYSSIAARRRSGIGEAIR